MNEVQRLQADPNPEAQAMFNELAADEDYWDYLDELEASSGDCHEWDNMVICGGAA